MKIAISVPDPVFRAGERLARRLAVPRSELYTRALIGLLADQPRDDLTAAYDAAFDEPAPAPEPLAGEAARRTLLAVEWEDRPARARRAPTGRSGRGARR